LWYEVFAGNRNGVTTLREIVERMEQRYGREGRIWALDRGMISAANLAWLQERGSRYIAGKPCEELRRFERDLLEGSWTEIREGLEVRVVTGQAGTETFVLCRSADRAAKERAMRERFEQRIARGLGAIARGCEQRRSDAGEIERRVGRLLGQNMRAARLFTVQVRRGRSVRVGIEWSHKAGALESARRRDGC
jgi:hypothetical protein